MNFNVRILYCIALSKFQYILQDIVSSRNYLNILYTRFTSQKQFPNFELLRAPFLVPQFSRTYGI